MKWCFVNNMYYPREYLNRFVSWILWGYKYKDGVDIKDVDKKYYHGINLCVIDRPIEEVRKKLFPDEQYEYFDTVCLLKRVGITISNDLEHSTKFDISRMYTPENERTSKAERVYRERMKSMKEIPVFDCLPDYKRDRKSVV